MKVCPDDILELFKDEATKPMARQKAADWMTAAVNEMTVGEKILIPHPETGKLMEYQKQARPLQS